MCTRQFCEAIINRLGPKLGGDFTQLLRVRSVGPSGGTIQEPGSDLKIGGDVLLSCNAFEKIRVPGLKGIGPRAEGVNILAGFFSPEASPPTVVSQRLH